MVKYITFAVFFLLCRIVLTDIVDVKVYPPPCASLKCSPDLFYSMTNLSEMQSPPYNNNITCIGKGYVNNGINFYASQTCPDISDVHECHSNFNLNNKILGQLQEISQFIDIFNSAFSNCSDVFQENTSSPSGYYTMRAVNGSLISVYCDDNAFDNCSQVFKENSSALSGYYTMRAPNGSLVSVYCDMEGSNCDGKGGWMRVGYINMSEPGATCPSGLNSYFFSNISYPLCDRPHPSNSGCNSTIFSTFGFNYSHVCGQVRGYQLGNVDGIYDNNFGFPSLDGAYVDGVSITHGSNPRHHIWTYIAGQRESGKNQWACPCNDGSTETTPQYVGDDYYCESGSPVFESYTFHYDDPLWDGKECDYLESPCCTSPNMPWFVKSLNKSSTDDIELRLCTSEGYPDEATPVDIIELYVC